MIEESKEAMPAGLREEGGGYRLMMPVTVVIALLFLGLYGDTIASLVQVWANEGTYSHGFLVVPIAIYLVFEKRRMLAAMEPAPSWLGVVALAGVSLVWAASEIIHAQLGAQLALVLLIAALVVALFGWRVARALAFPVAFLLFAIPVWDLIVTPPLQGFTAWATYHILQMLGVPTVLDGHFISIPEGVFEVASTCAGTRYFIAGLTLGSLFAYTMYQGWRKRLTFVAATIVACALVNVVRVVVVVMAGHLTDMQHPWVHDHVNMGWGLFIAFIVPLFWVGMRFADPVPSATDTGSRELQHRPAPGGRIVTMALASAVALGIGPLALQSVQGGAVAQAPERPQGIGGWHFAGDYDGPWTAGYVGPDLERAWRYRDQQGREVVLYFALYQRQEQGRELADAFNRPYDRDAWRLTPGGEPHRIVVEGAWPGEANELVIQSQQGGERLMVWQWYSVAGHATARRKEAKLLELLKLIEGGERPSLAIVLVTPAQDARTAHETLQAFMGAMGEGIEQSIHP